MTIAINGTMRNIPIRPPIAAPAGAASSTIAGWTWTVRPSTSGATKFRS